MAHHSTVFSQILKIVPRHEFEGLARKHQVGRDPRRMTRWNQFVAMAAGQLTERHSLRDVVTNMEAQRHKLYHLGGRPVSRTSLARVNEEQPCAFYEALFGKLLERCQGLAPKHKFRFNNPLYSLDASTIQLSLSVFPWARFNNAKGAVKIHLGLNHSGYLPEFVSLTNGKDSESHWAQTLKLPKGSIVVFDRGFRTYAWYHRLDQEGVFFVTRLQGRACVDVRLDLPVPHRNGVMKDQLVAFTGKQSKKKYPGLIRRVTFWDAVSRKQFHFFTNNRTLAARTIADIYKERWQIELFFKWIKQNLKIKTFLGTSFNAVKTQIWVALCVYLMLAFLRFTSKSTLTMRRILHLLQLNLFDRRPLMPLITGIPPDHDNQTPNQLCLL